MTTIGIAIVDDDPQDRQTTKDMTERYCSQKGLACRIAELEDGQDLIDTYKPVYDIVLLDVEMAFLNGLRTAEKLRALDQNVMILFTTRMAQYAAYGYDVDAIGYLVKPLEYYSFALKMDKAVRLRQRRNSVTLLLNLGDEKRIVPSDDVIYIDVRGHSLNFYTEYETLQAWSSMAEMEQQLQKAGFIRCSRYYLVNAAHIQSILDHDLVVGKNAFQAHIPVSRSRRQAVMEYLTSFYIGQT